MGRRMTRMLTITTLVASGLALAAPAFAQGMTDAQKVEFRRNCTADYSRLCANYQPDSPEVQQCFQRRIGEVSQRCQQTIAKFRR